MDTSPAPASEQRADRRYELLLKLASGGMATVYIGYLRGGLGFRQIVAIKRPHNHLLDDLAFRQSFIAEARVACRIHHANVVDVRDVDVTDESIDLVMDYVEGASLSRLLEVAGRSSKTVPPAVAIRIALDSCAGLHAAHETTDESGQRLGLIHRDVSPQNILVGIDGVSRVTDFGIAKCALSGDPSTQQGTLKGKLAYMAPEYLRSKRIDRRADVFAVGAVLWECLMGRRLFQGEHEADTIMRVVNDPVPPLAGMPEEIARAVGEVLGLALEKDPDKRVATALELGNALEQAAIDCGLRPNHRDVAQYVGEVLGAELQARRDALRDKIGARPSALPGDDPAQGSMPAAYESASAVHPSSLSLHHPRARASRAWMVPVAVLLVAGSVSAVIGMRMQTAASRAPSSAPEPAAPVPCAPAASASAPASASSPVPAASPPAPPRTADTQVPAGKRPPQPKPTASATTQPAPPATPKGPPPNPYAK